MSLISRALARVLAETPSIAAAARAGRRTSISVRVWRAERDENGNPTGHGRWVDYGPVASLSGTWRAEVERMLRSCVPVSLEYGVRMVGRRAIQFVHGGKEIERALD